LNAHFNLKMIIPQKLLDKHPDLTKKEIRMIASMILASRADKIRRAYILNFTVLGLGNFRSHASKKVRRYNKNKIKDRKRKRELQSIKENSKIYLLW